MGHISILPHTYGKMLITQREKFAIPKALLPSNWISTNYLWNLRFSWHLQWRFHYCDSTESNTDVPLFQMNLQQVSLKCWYYLPTTLYGITFQKAAVFTVVFGTYSQQKKLATVCSHKCLVRYEAWTDHHTPQRGNGIYLSILVNFLNNNPPKLC
jgi:hypothetical protein